MAALNVPVQHPRSAVAGAKPTSAQILQGQLALNFTDRKIWTLDNTGAIVQLGVALSDLAPVAATGNYNDLVNKPNLSATYTLPAAQAATLGGVMIPASSGLAVDGSGNLTAAVKSVAGRTGLVNLTATDVGLPTDLLSGPSTTLAAKYLPSSVSGALNYQGQWDASANSPSLASGVGTKGYYYVVKTAGSTSLDGNATWLVGDYAIFNGATWDRLQQSASAVQTVNGSTGNVTVNAANLPNLSQVGKDNLYASLTGIPSTFAPAAHTQAASTITGLATVATSGSYDDLTNKPPSADTLRLPVNVNGNPNVVNEVFYAFTDPAQFPQNFVGSKVVAALISGTTATVRIMAYNTANPGGVQVGTITIDTANGNSFTSVGSTTSFVAGDQLSYQFVTTNIARFTVTLRGTWLS